MAEQAASQGHRVEQREGPHGQQRAAFVFSSGPQLTPVPHGTELPASEPRQPLPGPQAAPARCRLRDELPGPGPCPAAPRWLPGGAPAAPGAGPEGSVGGCERPRAPPAAASVRGRGGLEAKRSPGGARPRRRPPLTARPPPPPHLTSRPPPPGREGRGGARAPRPHSPPAARPAPRPPATWLRRRRPAPLSREPPRRRHRLIGRRAGPMGALRCPLLASRRRRPAAGSARRAVAEGGKRVRGRWRRAGSARRGGAARASAPSARSCKGLREARWSQGAIQLFRPEELEDQ